jgi:primosomal replication protein N''
MTIHTPTIVRLCPNCRSERPVSELYCDNVLDGTSCNWPLADEPIRPIGGSPAPEPPFIPVGRRCVNGHDLGQGDEICVTCGGDPASSDGAPRVIDAPASATPTEETSIDGWQVLQREPAGEEPWERFVVRHSETGREAFLTLYRPGAEPDPAVHEMLRRISRDHIPELIATGRFEERAYEVIEIIRGETLQEAGAFAARNLDALRRIVEQVGRALADFAEVGLRHRDIRPGTLLLRSRNPIQLVVTDFGSARLSDFDLESIAALKVTRYSAPESIVGAVSAASDWWSLGMIMLEQATAGACFAGVNEKAFLIHMVTRGVDLQTDLQPELRPLLRGLLARDPLKRWHWPQVRSWLAGETVEAPAEPDVGPGEPHGPTVALAGRNFTRPELFALAAADAQNWDAARDLTLRGAVATWLEDRNTDRSIVASFRRLVSDERLPEDFRHALGLMSLNPSLPLTLKGDIITPAWLLQNPVDGYGIITGEVSRQLERMERELWLVRMRVRAEAVRERARLLEIDLDEDRLRIALLASSRARLEAERADLRHLFPETDHAGLSSLLERPRLSDEDLIVVVVAAHHQFISLTALLDAAQEQARLAGVALDNTVAQQSLVRPRREIFAEIDERISNFARCEIPRIDEWADSFRVERRMPLARAAVLLAVPRETWREPPKQQYVANLLQHFEKRVSGSVQRGPLVRFVLGKTTPRVDLAELGTLRRPAEAILNHVIGRTDVPITLDPDAFGSNEQLEARLRRLASHASMFRRDTGIDGRYLGFPFLLVRDTRLASPNAKPRIAPVLLWPVVLDVQAGAGGSTLVFDREREEIRLNPALEGLLGPQVYVEWREALQEVLERGVVRVGDVIDIFGALARPQGRTLTALPGPDVQVPMGTREIAPCAALFNAEFTGQAISEDLRQLRHASPAGTGLEAALRVSPDGPTAPPLSPSREVTRFLIVKSDPSQDTAILRARMSPGLLIEGPPGTGKSQTIVNMVADAIARAERVLIVCQKQAALKVVQKRLEAEGLGERLFAVVDINRDREGIVRALRDQVVQVRAALPDQVAALKRGRQAVAARIETLEAEIDRHHAALHEVDELSGSSYRVLLGELIGVEASDAIIEVPSLRPRFAELDRSEITRIEEICSSLARLWLESRYERSPLCVLRQFSVDDAIRRALLTDLSAFSAAEEARQAVLANTSPSFELEDPRPYRAWLDRCGPIFLNFSDLERKGLVAWFDLFKYVQGQRTVGDLIIESLEETKQELSTAKDRWHDPRLFERLVGLKKDELQKWLRAAKNATAPLSFMGRLSLRKWWHRRRVRSFLSELGQEATAARIGMLRDAIALEVLLRPLRAIVDDARAKLRIACDTPAALPTLRREVELLVRLLHAVQEAAAAAASCHRPRDAEKMAKSDSADSFAKLQRDFEDAINRYVARQTSRGALTRLSQWIEPEWIAVCEAGIAQGRSNESKLVDVVCAVGTLQSYQRFRARANNLDPEVMTVFSILREQEEALRATPADALESKVRDTIHREALLAWKGRMETSRPALVAEKSSSERLIRWRNWTANSESSTVNCWLRTSIPRASGHKPHGMISRAYGVRG